MGKITEEIENDKMEAKILSDYADEFDENFLKNLKLKEENEDNEQKSLIDAQYNFNSKNVDHFSEMNKKRQKEMENQNKINAFRKQRENKKKILLEKISKKEGLKSKLESELIKKRDILNKAKEEFLTIKNNLINRYHMKLYEGMSFHNEGLSSIIKDIWNLNSKVNISFMPSYLDSQTVQYLFQKAQQSIEISNLRKEIKEAENDFSYNLKNWKDNDSGLINSNYDNKIGNKFFNKKDQGKNGSLDEKELFKTKISDMSLSYLEQYPKTRQFIFDYRKNNPKKFKKEMPKPKFKTLKFRSLNIPPKIIEKNKNTEKLKCLLEMKLKQSEFNDKKEVERLNKEFTINNYQDKYNVNVETLFGSLFGDRKNEMLIYYSRLEKDLKDNNKIIRFHSKSNSIKFK